MRKIDLLKDSNNYSWVDNLEEVLELEKSPYFSIYDKTGQMGFRTIYCGCKDDYLTFGYYNFVSKKIDYIDISIKEILNGSYRYVKGDSFFDMEKAIMLEKDIDSSLLKKGKSYKLVSNTEREVLFLGRNEKELNFAWFNPWLNEVENFCVNKNKFLETYAIYKLE